MEIYQENIRKYVDEETRLKKLLNRISLLRLLVFAASFAIVLSLFSIDLITPVFFIVPVSIGVFVWIIKYYNRISYLKKHTLFLKNINEAEIKKIECDLEDFDPGEKFINPDHPYTSDLDIFGQHSIFQLINRTSTESGALLLSEWLSEPARKTEIYERQEAIRELSPDLDWRQDFQASICTGFWRQRG